MTQDLIGRIQRLLVSPAKEWDVIDGESANVEALYRGYIAPLVVLSALAGLVGRSAIGIGLFGYRPPLMTALGHAILSVILGLGMVYVFALIIDALAPSFGAAKNFGQAFKVAAYSPTATWVGGIFMLLPALRVLSALAALYSLYLLFVGLPKLMKPAPNQGMSYSLVAILCMVGLAIVVGALSTTGPFF